MNCNSNLPYYDKNDPWSSHSIIKTWVIQLPSGAKLLDIGSATGTLGRTLHSHNYHLTAIEPNVDWANLASPFYDQTICMPLEQVPDPLIGDMDAVVLADVLEHLPDPSHVLKHVVSLQPQHCQFFISIPNVANLWVRLQLLFGHFDYSDRGILDKTHLRFFTRKTVLTLLQNCALSPKELQVTPIPLNLLTPFFDSSPIGKLIFKLFAFITRRLPTLLGYQFVVWATKKVEGE